MSVFTESLQDHCVKVFFGSSDSLIGKETACADIYLETLEHSSCGTLNKFLKPQVSVSQGIYLWVSWTMQEPNLQSSNYYYYSW